MTVDSFFLNLFKTVEGNLTYTVRACSNNFLSVENMYIHFKTSRTQHNKHT